MSRGNASVARNMVRAVCGAVFAFGALEMTGVAHARSLESIRESGVLNICANADALPFSSQDPAVPGFQVEVAAALASRLGVKLNVNWIVFSRHAQRAQCDAVMGAVVQGRENVSREAAEGGETEGGAESLGGAVPEITHPYAASGYVLVVSETHPDIQTVEDVKRKGGRIGVEHGSWPHYLLSKRGLPTASYRSQADIVEAIGTGEVLAGLVTDPVAGWFMKQRRNAVRVVDPAPDPELRWHVGIRVLGPEQALMDAVNSSIDGLLAEQTIQNIFSKYGVPYVPPGVR